MKDSKHRKNFNESVNRSSKIMNVNFQLYFSHELISTSRLIKLFFHYFNISFKRFKLSFTLIAIAVLLLIIS